MLVATPELTTERSLTLEEETGLIDALDALDRGEGVRLTGSAVEQYRSVYQFVVPSTYEANFVNLVAPRGATVILDGNPIPLPTASVGNWSVWRLPIAAGGHDIHTSDGTLFGLKVLGVASHTSYAYPGGMNVSVGP